MRAWSTGCGWVVLGALLVALAWSSAGPARAAVPTPGAERTVLVPRSAASVLRYRALRVAAQRVERAAQASARSRPARAAAHRRYDRTLRRLRARYLTGTPARGCAGATYAQDRRYGLAVLRAATRRDAALRRARTPAARRAARSAFTRAAARAGAALPARGACVAAPSTATPASPSVAVPPTTPDAAPSPVTPPDDVPADALRAGAGRADITPPKLGYFLGGWTRQDRRALGQATRLQAKAIALQRGDRKVALVALELFAVPGGMAQEIDARIADLGYEPGSVLLSATHTHAAPGGYSPSATLNTAAPNLTQLLTTPGPALAGLVTPAPADPQLYTFLVRQSVAAIRAADADLAPAVAGWGHTTLSGLTQNRSLEAHLADHGIDEAPGQGTVDEDPEGYEDTIDPAVDVLRVDKLAADGSRVPIGAWSDFANHGTVVKSTLQAYSGDHHAAAHRTFEAGVRTEGRVPAGQEVVDVYPNADEGDQTAGLQHTGPAGAERVGRAEGEAMLDAWRSAAAGLSAAPALDVRATRSCPCDRLVADGERVSATGRPGVPFLTGSEEGRGPLYDATQVPLEGVTKPTPAALDPQGNKATLPLGEFPAALPLTVLRVGDGAIATMPGEPTREVGARTKATVAAALRPLGVVSVVVAGLTNEYVNYITTPQEYDRQHYEGASTMYGRQEGTFLQQELTELAARMADGRPAQEPAPYADLREGATADGPAYPEGAASGTLTDEPDATVARLGHARIAWTGGPSGADRPVGTPFITIERRDDAGAWQAVDSDLGLHVLWRADDQGAATADWSVPADAPTGTYRLVVTATRYRLASRTFALVPSAALAVAPVATEPGRRAVRLAYPAPVEDIDLADRPDLDRDGAVSFAVDGRTVEGRADADGRWSVPAAPGSAVRVDAGAARDAQGNVSRATVAVP